MFKVTKLNSISPLINDILTDNYALSTDEANPDAIILRSFKMHDYEIKENLLCVARAGAGVNNIPLDKMSEKGVVVFNTPGANANAVKELVLALMLATARNLKPAMDWANGLIGTQDVAKQVEAGKSQFVGPEIMGKTIGVIGLGAIGALVANACSALGMIVLGYDPFLSVDGAWNISSTVKHETDINALYAKCDYVTIHIPLLDSTKGFIGTEALSCLKDGAVIINCARGELVDNNAMKAALDSGKVSKYVTDFPSENILGYKNVIASPHLGASTPEAEDNCAIMAAKELKDYLENGNIVNSVNYPKLSAPRAGKNRITVAFKGEILSDINTALSSKNVSVKSINSAARNGFGYAIIDTDTDLENADFLKTVNGVLKVRKI